MTIRQYLRYLHKKRFERKSRKSTISTKSKISTISSKLIMFFNLKPIHRVPGHLSGPWFPGPLAPEGGAGLGGFKDTHTHVFVVSPTRTCGIVLHWKGIGCGRCSMLCRSGLSPPWQQKIFSSTIAATGRQLKQSVKVFHNLMLYLRLPEGGLKVRKLHF